MGGVVVKAVFKFIASALVGAGMGVVGANIVAGIITAGLAIGTARAFGSYLKPEIPGQGRSLNQGTRIQVAPDTSNRIQVCYGNVFTGGPVCDANISNENKTMNYFIVLSEKTDSGTFSIGDEGIRFGDKKLIFQTTSGDTHKISGVFDANGTSEVDLEGKIRVRVYAGNTTSSAQIFPAPGGNTSAVAATTMMPHWTALGTPHYKATDLVFAMVQVDYDAENGLTQMEPMTFDLRNSLSSPGNVMLDYMQNTRYGASIPSTMIDTDSFTGSGNATLSGYANETITYTDIGGSSATQPRYRINGTVSTANDVATNIDILMLASGGYMFFDGKQGKFKAIPNQVYQDQANCFVANDDNIISPIKIQNTDLFQMYNQVEVEYFEKNIRDQRNQVFIEIPSADRNTGEPDNKLTYSIDMVNNNMQAEILANIDLNQTRLDTVIEFTGDHSFLQVDVGDVIKVTNSTYGFTDKLFRVMRIKEMEDVMGALMINIVGMEYSDDVYAGPSVIESAVFGNISMPTIKPIGPIIPLKYFNKGNNANLELDPTVYGNVVHNDVMTVFGAGTQLADNPANKVLANATSNFNIANQSDLLLSSETYDISGINLGDYELTAVAQPAGSATGSAYNYGLRGNVDVVWANATATHTQSITTSMQFQSIPDGVPPTSVSLAKKMDLTLAG